LQHKSWKFRAGERSKNMEKLESIHASSAFDDSLPNRVLQKYFLLSDRYFCLIAIFV
jgi:hypothetical protein